MKSNSKASSILTLLDFSPHSEAALATACEFAGCFNAPLTILHVVHDPGDAPGSYAEKGRRKHLRRMDDVANEMMAKFLQRMQSKHPDWKALATAKTIVVVGLPVKRILEVIDEIEPRMVVMGSAGRTGLERLMLGSKAEQVARLSPAPVTIVKV